MMEKVIGSLDGVGGNAVDLMCYFRKLAKEQKFKEGWINSVISEATSYDYAHLVNTLLDKMEEGDSDE